MARQVGMYCAKRETTEIAASFSKVPVKQINAVNEVVKITAMYGTSLLLRLVTNFGKNPSSARATALRGARNDEAIDTTD